MLTKFSTYRRINILLFLASCFGMAFALYIENTDHLDPCPLCIFQRVGLIEMGLFALLAAIFNPIKLFWRRFFSFLALLGMLWSTVVASRHVWLQHLPPDQVPSCGPGLEYWVKNFPLDSVIAKVFKGSGECAVVDWTFLGYSLPHWSLLAFVILLVLCLFQLFRRR